MLFTYTKKHMNKKIPHIIVVASYFYPKIGGLENYAFFLAKKLHESGRYTVSIVTSNYAGTGYLKEYIDGMTIHRLAISFKVSNTPINLSWYGEVKKIFADENPDLVHVHSPVPYLPDIAAHVAKSGRKKIPVVLTYHSGSMLKGSFLIDIIIVVYEKIFLRKIFSSSDAVVAISQEFAKRTFPQFQDKTCFIPTGVDLQRFSPTPLPSQDRVTYVGRIEHSSSWKGVEQLLQAMVIVVKKRRKAVLELVGGGDALDYYKTRAEELGIKNSVIFSGPQMGQNIVEAYRRSTVVALPSTSDSEAFSITLVEAMASGRPIIGTNIGGTPQVIEHSKNGFLVPPKDPAALAQAILMILEDKSLAQKIGEYGRVKAQGFSWDLQGKKYSNLFDLILEKNTHDV